MRNLTIILLIAMAAGCAQPGPNDRQGRQWEMLEWNLPNPGWQGNPYDLIAAVAFVHAESGERRFSYMYYDGGDTWSFRFTPTQVGLWQFQSLSDAPDLNGVGGRVRVLPNPDGRGFVTALGDKWGWSGTGQAFVPQLVMAAEPDVYAADSTRLDADIGTFLKGHGFNGLHVAVKCRWFNLDVDHNDAIDTADPNPDPRTFDVLETIIRKVYAAGGMVHFWAWGDDQRHQTPVKWGINGMVDKRLQRYIAARLGPQPGWTMGYGFDLFEWVSGDQLTEWHDFMHEIFGWPHLLGGRGPRDPLGQLSENLDYSSYQQHRPDYAMYERTIDARPGKPSFSEDRFRIRNIERYRSKDYDADMTRRGLWHSTMAGGVANIWGYLPDGRSSALGSAPYPSPDGIRTWSRFFHRRFTADLVRDNGITDGVCLRDPGHERFLFYREDASDVSMDLSGAAQPLPATAVDTRKPYHAIDIGVLNTGRQQWTAPYKSDWAVAVGEIGGE